MSITRGSIKDTTSILARLDHRLFPNDLRHMKLALVDYCIDAELDPGDISMSVQLLEHLLPLIQLQNDSWIPLTISELNLNKAAIRSFYDCIRHQLSDLDRLREKISEAKEDRDLCQAID